MSRRLWISVALAVPMLALMVSAFLPAMPMQHLFSARVWAWIEFALATPVVLWCGLPFFVRGWQSIVHRSLNMFTLDRPWYRLGLSLQRLRYRRSPNISCVVSWSWGADRCVLRAGSSHRCSGPSRTGVGVARSQPNQRCDSRAAWPGSEDSEDGLTTRAAKPTCRSIRLLLVTAPRTARRKGARRWDCA
jgi:hypothetical protein